MPVISQLPVTILRNLRPPQFVRVPFLLSYVCMLSMFLIVLVAYFKIQPVVPLFYSLARPVEQLAPKIWIFTIPISIAVITFAHLGLVYKYTSFDELLMQLFSWTTLIINILLSMALIRILIIVT